MRGNGDITQKACKAILNITCWFDLWQYYSMMQVGFSILKYSMGLNKITIYCSDSWKILCVTTSF